MSWIVSFLLEEVFLLVQLPFVRLLSARLLAIVRLQSALKDLAQRVPAYADSLKRCVRLAAGCRNLYVIPESAPVEGLDMQIASKLKKINSLVAQAGFVRPANGASWFELGKHIALPDAARYLEPNTSICQHSTEASEELSAAIVPELIHDVQMNLSDVYPPLSGDQACPVYLPYSDSEFPTWFRIESGLVKLQLQAPPPQVDPRLQVILDDPPRAILDGIPYPVSRTAAIFLKALLDANGAWVWTQEITSTFPEYEGSRVQRVKESLPPTIAALVESSPGKGSRLVLLPDGAAEPKFGAG